MTGDILAMLKAIALIDSFRALRFCNTGVAAKINQPDQIGAHNILI
jgi:hypothetical protein